MYKLLNWIYIDKLNSSNLSSNTNSIDILEKNPYKIDWYNLSSNQNATHLLEKNKDKIDWRLLSSNPNAIHLLEQNKDKIVWSEISKNPSIFELDYNSLKTHCNIYKEELIKKALHPDRIMKYLESGIDFEDLDNFI